MLLLISTVPPKEKPFICADSRKKLCMSLGLHCFSKRKKRSGSDVWNEAIENSHIAHSLVVVLLIWQGKPKHCHDRQITALFCMFYKVTAYDTMLLKHWHAVDADAGRLLPQIQLKLQDGAICQMFKLHERIWENEDYTVSFCHCARLPDVVLTHVAIDSRDTVFK